MAVEARCELASDSEVRILLNSWFEALTDSWQVLLSETLVPIAPSYRNALPNIRPAAATPYGIPNVGWQKEFKAVATCVCVRGHILIPTYYLTTRTSTSRVRL